MGNSISIINPNTTGTIQHLEINRLSICEEFVKWPFVSLNFQHDEFTIDILDKKNKIHVSVTFSNKSLFLNHKSDGQDVAMAWKNIQDIIKMPPESARRLKGNNAKITIAYRHSLNFHLYATVNSAVDDNSFIIVRDQRTNVKSNFLKKNATSRLLSAIPEQWTMLEPGLYCLVIVPHPLQSHEKGFAHIPGTTDVVFRIPLTLFITEKQNILKPPTGGWLEQFCIYQKIDKRFDRKAEFSFYISDVDENEMYHKYVDKTTLPQLPQKQFSIPSQSYQPPQAIPSGSLRSETPNELIDKPHISMDAKIITINENYKDLLTPQSKNYKPSILNTTQLSTGLKQNSAIQSAQSPLTSNKVDLSLQGHTQNAQIANQITSLELKDVGAPKFDDIVEATSRLAPYLNTQAKKAHSELQGFINAQRQSNLRAYEFVTTMMSLADIDDEFKVQSNSLIDIMKNNSDNLCNSLERICLSFLENIRQGTIKTSDNRKKEYDLEEKDYAIILDKYLSPNNNINDAKCITDVKMAERKAFHHRKQIEYYAYINEICGNQMKQNIFHIVHEFFRLNLDYYKNAYEDQKYSKTTRNDMKVLSEQCTSSLQTERRGVEELLHSINNQIAFFSSFESTNNDIQPGQVPFTTGIYGVNDNQPEKGEKTFGYSTSCILNDKADFDPITNELVKKRGYLLVANFGSNISGNISKNFGLNFKKTWCYVTDGKFFETRKGTEEVRELNLCTVKDLRIDRKFCFEIIDPFSRKIYQASDALDMKEWINALRYNIDTSLNKPQVNLKQNDQNDGISIPSILQLESLGNHICCDCGQVQPSWSSINLGCLICIQCSGIHRELSTTYSKVRSISLDVNNWTAPLLEMMKCLGNNNVNQIYEEVSTRLPVKPNGGLDSMELRKQYIFGKYKLKSGVVPLNNPHDSLISAISRCSLPEMLAAYACGAKLVFNEENPAEILATILGFINKPKEYLSPRLAAAEWLLINDVQINGLITIKLKENGLELLNSDFKPRTKSITRNPTNLETTRETTLEDSEILDTTVSFISNATYQGNKIQNIGHYGEYKPTHRGSTSIEQDRSRFMSQKLNNNVDSRLPPRKFSEDVPEFAAIWSHIDDQLSEIASIASSLTNEGDTGTEPEYIPLNARKKKSRNTTSNVTSPIHEESFSGGSTRRSSNRGISCDRGYVICTMTVLHLAALHEDQEAIDYLISKGCDASLQDSLFRTHQDILDLRRQLI